MEDLRQRVQEILKGHEYTLLTNQTNNDIGWKNINCEVWHCGNNGSSVFAFDICIMPMGIAVCGDIGELTFNVYGRGIEFLAGRDINYYIHSKLSPHCKEKEFNEKYFYSHVMEYLLSEMEEKDFIEDEVFENLATFSNNDDFRSFKYAIDNIYLSKTYEGKEEDDYLEKLYHFLDQVYYIEDDRSAHELLYNSTYFEFADSWECDFTDIDKGLLFKLYMVNEAAKQILEIKNKD